MTPKEYCAKNGITVSEESSRIVFMKGGSKMVIGTDEITNFTDQQMVEKLKKQLG